ncbi:MAG: hypothetical protein AAF558_00425 [Verrucomicrobiota bacterium]
MYHLNKDGQNLEILDADTVEQYISAERLQPTDWVWDDITESWVPLSDLFPEHFPTFPENQPTELINRPKEPPKKKRKQVPHEPYCTNGQRKTLVQSVLKALSEILEPSEPILYVATQRKPIPDPKPEAVALTVDHIYLFSKSFFQTRCEPFPLQTILTPKLDTGLFFSHFSFGANAGDYYGIRFLPKVQGREFYNRFMDRLDGIRQAQKSQLPADAPTVVTTVKPRSQPLPKEASKPNLANKAAQHRQLESLKQMLDDGLISSDDYSLKKQAIENQL